MADKALFFTALRYLWGQEGGRYLRGAAAGIALSLVPIIVTLIVADGMIRGITDRYLELGTGHLQVNDFTGNGEFPPELTERLLAVDGVRGVWRERKGEGIILGNKGRTGAAIRAVEEGFWTDPGSAAFLEIVSGTAKLESDRDILLGRGLAETLQAEPGSTVRLMTVRVNEEGKNIPRVTIFTVRGIVSSGYRELDSLWCIMSYRAGLQLLSPELYPPVLLVKTASPYSGIERAAGLSMIIAGPGYSVRTWKEINRSLYSSYESTRQMLLFIMALLVLVAAVNVSSAASMLVIERQRDIAVLKACGAGPPAIRGIFLWASFLTGAAGAVIGISLGLLAGGFINPIIRGLEKALSLFSSPWGKDVRILDPDYYLADIPIIIDWKAILLIGVFTLLCSCLAAALPARRAGRLKPLDILRRV